MTGRILIFLLCVLLPLAVEAGPAEVVKSSQKALKNLDETEENGVRRGRLYERIGNAERQLKRQKAARRAYRKALDEYTRGDADDKRDRLLSRISERGKGWSKKSAAYFDKFMGAWAQLKELHTQARKFKRRDKPADIDEIDPEVYTLMQEANRIRKQARKWRYQALAAAALEVEGRVLGATGDLPAEVEKYREAAELCERACPGRRRTLLFETARLMERQGELVGAYKLFAEINAEKIEDLPEERRRYGRSEDLVRVCAKLRRKSGVPSCLRLEHSTVGFMTFRDFSAGPTRSKLTKAEMGEVHADYLPLLTGCLAKAAKSGEAEPGETFELDWAVRNDGRAIRFQCNPSVEGLQLGECFKNVLDMFRDPRYRGERRNVTVPLAVGKPD
jgi:tetratricopeptide (TPR) repeat protein